MTEDVGSRFDQALRLTAETDAVDFKREFDPSSTAHWCELVKDLAAMANTGGGLVIIGLEDDGTPSPGTVTNQLLLDPADIANKIHKYTDGNLAGIHIHRGIKNRSSVLGIEVPGLRVPLIFTAPGTYPIEGGRQSTAFSKGTVYFRHGAKSEPGTSEDLRLVIDREIIARREEWLGNIRRVVEAPPGATVQVIHADVTGQPQEGTVGVRLVHDPTAPSIPRWSPDETHPHRLKDLISVVNQRLAGETHVNSYDIMCVRRVHNIDADPNFYYRSKRGSPQYSEAFVEWLIDQFRKENNFFRTARARLAGRSGELFN